ncbi:MAG: C39 family peptidase [Balneolaceae bacterium]
MLAVPIKQQPDETTCGPTCLHAMYDFYRDPISLKSVIDEVHQLDEGGTLGVLLANHALERGYKATIYSYNLQIFDPTWAGLNNGELAKKLVEQMAVKKNKKFRLASEAYIRFLELGGTIRVEDLRSGIIRRYLKKNRPVIAGLSATWLYRSMREFGPNSDYDDLRGEPAGHFVVLHGYEPKTREIYIADPIAKNPLGGGQYYKMKLDRVITAVLLGIVTYDANLIVITPKPS